MWFSHSRNSPSVPVCVLCGCLLLRQTKWLNQYKWPWRAKETTRKCSIIKLNYRQALTKTNKYFVTISLFFLWWGWLRMFAELAQFLGEGIQGCVLTGGSSSLSWALKSDRMWKFVSVFSQPHMYLPWGNPQDTVKRW